MHAGCALRESDARSKRCAARQPMSRRVDTAPNVSSLNVKKMRGEREGEGELRGWRVTHLMKLVQRSGAGGDGRSCGPEAR